MSELPPSKKAEYYRARAMECERRAEEMRNPDVAREFRSAAAMWQEMAKQAERQGW